MPIVGRKIMRAGPGPALANACGQPRRTYIMLPGPPRATVAPVCDCQPCQLPGVRTREPHPPHQARGQ
jgi:hypothetical protein